MIARPDPAHRAALAGLVRAVPEFDQADAQVALELIDAALGGSPDYELLVDHLGDGSARGYVCFGPTPMTHGTWDLYWIAAHPLARRLGVGAALIREVESVLRARGARLIRVETASNDAYQATRAFYDRMGYREEARLRDFYKPGDDLVIYARRLGG
jgi:ribosomal protein S18 acetylase RimI-like enzyme